jgi:hypothetical protein
VLARVSGVVEHTEDPTAPHPEIQRHLGGIRTDLDRFTPLEISSLIRHGYCIGRSVCRERPELFGSDLPSGPPWDPYAKPTATLPPAGEPASAASLRRERTAITAEARSLQASAGRRLWSRFFDRRDWVSFVYVPILVPILLILPFASYRAYKRSVRLNNLTLSYAQGSPDLAKLDHMLDEDPEKPWKGVVVEEGNVISSPNVVGFKVLSDSRITDLRAWNPAAVANSDSASRVHTYRRICVVKQPETQLQALFTSRLILAGAEGEVRFPNQDPPARVIKTLVGDGKKYRWDAVFDLTKAPVGVPTDLVIEVQSPGIFLRGSESATGMGFSIETETAELSQWVLMPKGKRYEKFRYIRYKKGQPDTAEDKHFVTQYLAEDHSMLAFKLLALDPGFEHEISWVYEARR